MYTPRTTFAGDRNPFTGVVTKKPAYCGKYAEELELMFEDLQTLEIPTRAHFDRLRRASSRFLHARNACDTVQLRRKTDTRTRRILTWFERTA